jgi:hypothetical protein
VPLVLATGARGFLAGAKLIVDCLDIADEDLLMAEDGIKMRKELLLCAHFTYHMAVAMWL